MITFTALVERLSSVQREREKVLATQLRTALEDKEKLQRRLLQNGYSYAVIFQHLSNACEVFYRKVSAVCS